MAEPGWTVENPTMLALLGSLLGFVVDVASPWPELILELVDGVLATPSIDNFPGMSALVRVAGMFFAYVFFPLLGGVVGYSADSRE